MLRAIEEGFVQREIGEAAYRDQQAVESGRRVVVGVNRFQQEDGQAPALLKVDSAVLKRQRTRLARVRAERDRERVQTALSALGEAAGGERNLLPRILDCVRAYATVGEICDTLRSQFGTYRPPVVV
jgi:methylmalonyl-CoA mutase N-terminal domain/subunit